MTMDEPVWMQGVRHEHVARALLALSERLQESLDAPLRYGEADIDPRRRIARASLSDVRAIHLGRPLRRDDVIQAHARVEAMVSYRAMLTRVSDGEISEAAKKDRDSYESQITKSLALMSGLMRPSRAAQPMSMSLDTRASVEMSAMLGGPVETVSRARADMMTAGLDVFETEDGHDAVQHTGGQTVTLSAGHESESEAWEWLAAWWERQDRDAPAPLDTSPG